MSSLSDLPRRMTVAPVLLCLAVTSGCSLLEQKPTARIVGANLQDVSLQDATLAFDVEISNPYSVPLPLVDVDYSLAGRGKSLLTGKAPLTGTVPAGSSRRVQVPATVVFREVFSALSDFRPGGVLPYTAEMGFSVDAPVVGRTLRLPVRKEGELPIPTAPGIRVENIRWEQLDLREARGVVTLEVTNRNQFAMDLLNMAANLKLADVQVAQTTINKQLSLGASGDTGTLEIPISFSAAKVGLGIFRMLRGSGANYQLDGSIDVDTPYAPMSLPISAGGTAPFLR